MDGELFMCQIYVDDIIFGSSNPSFSEEFKKMMADMFEMSMMGELNFFLGLQMRQRKNGTFIFQKKYVKDMLKKFDMVNAKGLRTPIQTNSHLDLKENGNPLIKSISFRDRFPTLSFMHLA